MALNLEDKKALVAEVADVAAQAAVVVDRHDDLLAGQVERVVGLHGEPGQVEVPLPRRERGGRHKRGDGDESTQVNSSGKLHG